MNARCTVRFLPASIALLLFATLPGTARAQDANTISSRTAEVGGVTLHYLTAGHGPAVILLHGYTQTSRMWRPIMPRLAEKFTVIAPDLPGIGDSSIPKDGLDMKTAAIRIHALAKSLGVQKAEVVDWTHGRLRIRCAVPGRNRETDSAGRISSRRGRVGGCLQ